MLTLFKTKQDLANIFLIPYLILIRLSIFFSPAKVDIQTYGLLTDWMFNEINPNSFSGRFLALFLVFVQAVFINILANRFRFSRELSLLPGLFYCLLMSLTTEFLTLNGFVLGNTFVILALFFLLDIYKRNDRVANNIFSVGFWLGFACLFDYLYVFFFIWAIIGIVTLVRFNFKDILILLIGGFQAVFLFSVYLFYYDKLTPFFQDISQHFGWLNFYSGKVSSLFLKLGFCFSCLLFVLLMSGYIFRQQSLAIQKFLSILYVYMFVVGFGILFISKISVEEIMLLALPMCIMFTLIIQKLPSLFGEFLHLGIVVAALLLQFEFLLVK
jgi:ABC-type multidrug transport system fused ATPase/permease subunit